MLLNKFSNTSLEAGCDEAGRGCLAGPVFGAAVILPSDFHDPQLNDSKKLTDSRRRRLRTLIEREALAWSVQSVSAARIDEINILNASHEAMTLAVKDLAIRPELLLIDGNLFRTDLEIPYECIIGGDALYASIAAASILAKTYRDDYMLDLNKKTGYDLYGWSSNKGYPTKIHRAAIEQYGLTDEHKVTFGRK